MVVIGAGDAAIENVLALANHNRVVLINRNDEFARCKERNLSLVLAAIEDEWASLGSPDTSISMMWSGGNDGQSKTEVHGRVQA